MPRRSGKSVNSRHFQEDTPKPANSASTTEDSDDAVSLRSRAKDREKPKRLPAVYEEEMSQKASSRRVKKERGAGRRSFTERSTGVIWNLTWDLLAFVGATLFDVIRASLFLLKTPLSLLIVGFLGVTLFRYCFEALLQSVLVPICTLPVLSTALPFCPAVHSWKNASIAPDYPKLLELQSGFENLLESSSGTALALDIKKAEIALKDLNTMVKISHLVCKDALAEKLDEFVGEARDVGRGLQRLGSRVGGAVDIIIAMDDYAIRSLEAITPKQIPSSAMSLIESPSSLVNVMVDTLLGRSWSTKRAQRAMLIRTFNLAAQEMQSQLGRLIVEAEADLILLDRLEVMLDTIHSIVTKNDVDIQVKRDEVLADLWTKLGGNRAKLSVFAAHRTLLGNVSRFRKTALMRVSATILQLRQLSTDLDDLRDRVTAPSIMGEQANGEGGIPIEVHIESIRKGVERLGEYRKRSIERENDQLKAAVSAVQLPGAGGAVPEIA